MKKLIILAFAVASLTACNQPKQERVQDATQVQHHEPAPLNFTADQVDNKKDPACGMPTTAGISDTLHYDGKVFGFCSPDCKEGFKADPKSMLAKAELK